MSIFELFSFGEGGWGYLLLSALITTLGLAIAGMCLGAVFGICGALSALSGIHVLQALTRVYTTIMRGIPDLLVVYLFYFGSSSALTAIAHLFGAKGFVGAPEFAIGVFALGIVSGAYLTEVFRGAIQAIDKGEIEAALAFGMRLRQRMVRIVLPLAFLADGSERNGVAVCHWRGRTYATVANCRRFNAQIFYVLPGGRADLLRYFMDIRAWFCPRRKIYHAIP